MMAAAEEAGPYTAAVLERIMERFSGLNTITPTVRLGPPDYAPPQHAAANEAPALVAPAPAALPMLSTEDRLRPRSIIISGTVLEAARVAVGPGRDPQALLTLKIAAHQGPPLCVQLSMGKGYAAHMAASQKALRLRLGQGVTVACEGVGIARTSTAAIPMLTCLGVLAVHPHQAAPLPPAGAAGPQD